jgi:carotenoid cleavage dioxygenase
MKDRRPTAEWDAPVSPHNRFLEGPFAPVTEEITAFDLPVTGQIPAELNGRLFRNGPNPMGLDDPNYHWFIGAGMLHGVRLRDRRAEWYRNRWVRSQAVATALDETWPGGPVHAGMDFAANTHVISHAGRILATVEAGPLPYELSPELETVGPCDFGGTLSGGFAAHTKLDRRTGELHAIAYFWGWDYVQHVVVDREGKVSRTTNIPVADAPMMHDFALTENHLVLFDLPVTFSMDAVSAGKELPYVWNPAHQPRVGLLPLDGNADDIRWIEVDPCFVFHTLNGYEDSGRVVVDLCRYETAYDVATMTGPGPVTLDRWIIDPSTGKLAEQRLDDRLQEFPRIDGRLTGQPHRYGYCAVIGEGIRATLSMEQGTSARRFGNALIKHDLRAGTVESHEFGEGATTGEAVFAPRAPDAGEDEGYVMAFVHDPERGAADLVILAAQDFGGEPVARVHLPARVPQGFHGSWMPDQKSDARCP